MKLRESSFRELADKLHKVLGEFASKGDAPVVTDIYFKPVIESEELVVYDDDEELATLVVSGLAEISEEHFYPVLEHEFRRVLLEVSKRISFSGLPIWKPFSFVLVDEDKESVAELLLIDDDTVLASQTILEGLDDELDNFLKKLLSE